MIMADVRISARPADSMEAGHLASVLSDKQLMKRMINSRNDCGQTLLIRTIFLDDTNLRHQLLTALLSLGVDTEACDAYGRNALMWACLFQRATEVTQLVDRANSLDLMQMDINGNMALHLAVTSGSAGVVKKIIDAMLNRELPLSISNHSGITPLMQAGRLGYDVCYSLIKSNLPEEMNTVSCHSKLPSESYRHTPRQVSVESTVVPLPPILSPEIKSRMEYLESKACHDCTNQDPSRFLMQVCHSPKPPQTTHKKPGNTRLTKSETGEVMKGGLKLPKPRKSLLEPTVSSPKPKQRKQNSLNCAPFVPDSLPRLNI